MSISKKISLQAEIRSYSELPPGAVVDIQQAESALGHNVADDVEDADVNANDRDVRAEEEALLGRLINPPGLDYACFTPDFSALDEETCDRLGIETNDHKRPITKKELIFNSAQAQKVLEDSLQDQEQEFARLSKSKEQAKKRSEKAAELDPTQKLVYDTFQLPSSCTNLNFFF